MKKRIFVSTSVYALAHQLGMAGAIEEVKRQLDSPGKDSLPVVRTITRLRNLDAEVQLHVDGGATYIGMARSRAFHEAFKTGLPWIALDDDIEVTTDTAGALLDCIDDVVPRIVLVPYYTRDRDNPRLTITLPMVRAERIRNGSKLLALPAGAGGGFGMVGMNRLAMEAIVEHAADAELTWFDDGEKKLALFYERLEDGLWYGEDTSFFKFRVPSSVSVEALLVGTVLHGDVPLRLDTL
jgi:hypothetical protein